MIAQHTDAERKQNDPRCNQAITHYESLSWIDSLLNASMILGGMGPVNPLRTNAGKVFASFYALYSGIILLASVGILATPIFHRFMHRFHLELEDD